MAVAVTSAPRAELELELELEPDGFAGIAVAKPTLDVALARLLGGVGAGAPGDGVEAGVGGPLRPCGGVLVERGSEVDGN